ncbi:tetratricopeptide repeat protein [Aquiflexum lacus]|uniref:tetratricopeptide repeat protein n=1 Tax=Aquiflexum lacus TaxID=2483805 RepID=UPI0018936D13|nr:hypothetical protein [Aquiflexum lacus]
MNKITLRISIIVLSTFLSCKRTDFSNPEEVIKSFRTLTKENKNEKLYDEFLSSKSKEFVTKDEFVKTMDNPDSILNETTRLESKVYNYPVDVVNPSYRRFKVEEKEIFKKDTVYSRFYFSLINENAKWKVVWTSSLFSFAEKKFIDGNYSEARKTLEKIIELDPFSGRAYNFLAIAFFRDQSLKYNEWENGVVKNARYAVTLEEDNFLNYNTLAIYYSSINNLDLSIQNYERGLAFCQNNKDKFLFYTNLAGEYITLKKFEEAEEYIRKSIEINDKNTFAWYMYGILKQAEGKNLEALEHFEKSISEKKMENYLQGSLYYSYSLCCFDLGKCDLAKEHIIKALDIEPNNDTYLDLFNKIKYCNARTK